MKTAKRYAAAYYLDCPECGEGLHNPDGSLMWLMEHLPAGKQIRTAICANCGATVKLPRL